MASGVRVDNRSAATAAAAADAEAAMRTAPRRLLTEFSSGREYRNLACLQPDLTPPFAVGLQFEQSTRELQRLQSAAARKVNEFVVARLRRYEEEGRIATPNGAEFLVDTAFVLGAMRCTASELAELREEAGRTQLAFSRLALLDVVLNKTVKLKDLATKEKVLSSALNGNVCLSNALATISLTDKLPEMRELFLPDDARTVESLGFFSIWKKGFYVNHLREEDQQLFLIRYHAESGNYSDALQFFNSLLPKEKWSRVVEILIWILNSQQQNPQQRELALNGLSQECWFDGNRAMEKDVECFLLGQIACARFEQNMELGCRAWESGELLSFNERGLLWFEDGDLTKSFVSLKDLFRCISSSLFKRHSPFHDSVILWCDFAGSLAQRDSFGQLFLFLKDDGFISRESENLERAFISMLAVMEERIGPDSLFRDFELELTEWKKSRTKENPRPSFSDSLLALQQRVVEHRRSNARKNREEELTNLLRDPDTFEVYQNDLKQRIANSRDDTEKSWLVVMSGVVDELKILEDRPRTTPARVGGRLDAVEEE